MLFSSSRFSHVVLASLVAVAVSAMAAAGTQAQRGRVEPERATGLEEQSLATAQSTMVSSANAHATRAGLEMLRAGGSAADAAIAIQLVLGLVEPQSSGLGGGAFIVHHDAASDELLTYDGRETAPASAKPQRFLKADGSPIGFMAAVNSGLSIGVPGTVRLLGEVHTKHGKLPWKTLFEPALRLARDGFPMSQRLHLLLRWVGREKFTGGARTLFFNSDGAPKPAGTTIVNRDYVETLRVLAEGGADAFYGGKIAEKIVTAAAEARGFKSGITLADLAGYRVVTRQPICATYRAYKACGMGPPSSGSLAVIQTLKLLEPFDLGKHQGRAMNRKALHLIAEAQKLAYADRDRYLADPDFISIPIDGLLDDAYLAERRRLISETEAMSQPAAGKPKGFDQGLFGDDFSIERTGTSHLSVIDKDGNTASMTTTIEGAFGSGHWTAGFLLNNELTDFSFKATDTKGRPVANRVEGGKRPRSTMAPMIVYGPDGNVFAALGSPGGSRIILFVTKAIVALVDWRMDALQAASLPNFGSRGSGFEIESGFDAIWTGLKMKALGHSIKPDMMNSGLHIVVRRPDRLEGAADPRREGLAAGD